MGCTEYGARVERGQVVSVSDGKMSVQSLERREMISNPMPSCDGNNYEAGTKVFYMQFDDGSGMVLCRAYSGGSSSGGGSQTGSVKIHVGTTAPEDPTDGMIWIVPDISDTVTFTADTGETEQSFKNTAQYIYALAPSSGSELSGSITYTLSVPVSVASGTVAAYLHATLTNGTDSLYLGYVTVSGAGDKQISYSKTGTEWLGTDVALNLHLSSKADNTTDAKRSGISIPTGDTVRLVCKGSGSGAGAWKECSVKYYQA